VDQQRELMAADDWTWASEATPELQQAARDELRNGGTETIARMRADQDGLCWLCRRPLPEERHLVHVDHDHACCPPNRSCAACRRGLTHPACNVILAMAHEDMDLLREIITNYEQLQPLVRARIEARANLEWPQPDTALRA
jgi:Recombination endonuclease VII